jgi:hypothetical protein
MPDLIPAKDGIFDRHPVFFWNPACAGMTNFGYSTAGVILTKIEDWRENGKATGYRRCRPCAFDDLEKFAGV